MTKKEIAVCLSLFVITAFFVVNANPVPSAQPGQSVNLGPVPALPVGRPAAVETEEQRRESKQEAFRQVLNRLGNLPGFKSRTKIFDETMEAELSKSFAKLPKQEAIDKAFEIAWDKAFGFCSRPEAYQEGPKSVLCGSVFDKYFR